MQIGLTLSGGGMRAIAFHLGVMLRLAAARRLESVTAISTVSGGSIAAALCFFGMDKSPQWPSSEEFCQIVYPKLRLLVTSHPLVTWSAIACSPRTWPRLFHARAHILAHFLESRWAIRGDLSGLPDKPIWFINATSLETATNWRFSRREMGDWRFGRLYAPKERVANAVAASTAVPYVIGKLTIRIPEDGWYDYDPATDAPVKSRRPALKKVTLWDGGVYENLGLEPLYKPGPVLRNCDTLVVSDASGPIGNLSSQLRRRNAVSGDLHIPRLYEISSEQIRAIRSRMLVRDFETARVSGALIRMGNSVRQVHMKTGKFTSSQDLSRWQPDDQVSSAWQYPTNLSRMSLENFDLISRHGFECTDAILMAYLPASLTESSYWPAS